MKFFCPKCKSESTKTKGDYWYYESGLDNVLLRNITINECNCGLSYPTLFRVSHLNNMIAKELILKADPLTGKEIKFLRKNLRYSSKSFSEMLGVDNTTLSKWENGLQAHSEQNDKLVRLFCLILSDAEKNRVVDMAKELSLTKHFRKSESKTLIVELRGDNYYCRWLIPTSTTKKVLALRSKALQTEPASPATGLIAGIFHACFDSKLNKIALNCEVSN